MSQQPAFEVTGLPQDISAGREAGCYLAQFSIDSEAAATILYATAETPPADDGAYFSIDVNDSKFTFRAGPGVLPTWVKQPLQFKAPSTQKAFLAVAKVD